MVNLERWNLNTLDIARSIIETLEDHKGEKILLLDIHDLAVFTDYFIICTGTSDRMIDSLADAVRETAKQRHGIIARSEGKSSDGWDVVDLGDIVIHLFSPDQRDYYKLEELWSEGRVLLRLQ
jgi:ribosome-associated protein